VILLIQESLRYKERERITHVDGDEKPKAEQMNERKRGDYDE
jgi:hypothetical protein